MRVIICDRCKGMIPHPDLSGIGSICLEVKSEKGTPIKANTWKNWDLCQSCVADITQYVEAPLQEKPKAVIKKRRVKVDQTRELAQAGKGIKEIAAEVSCSEQTVSNHIKKEEHEEAAADSVSESYQEDRD